MIDKDKLRSAVLYIVNKKVTNCDFHTLFKVLYFADMWHLAQYGRPVIDDSYASLPDGPVPSLLYDALKDLNGKEPSGMGEFLKNDLTVRGYHITANSKPDMEELSVTDVMFLDQAWNEISVLDYDGRKTRSHGDAYHRGRLKSRIDIYDMAREGGATEDLIQEMKEADLLVAKLA